MKIFIALLALLVALVLVPTAAAGKATATVTLDQASPSFGDTVTFTATYDLNERYGLPYMVLDCFQDGAHVYSGGTGFGWGAYPAGGSAFTLASTLWTSGPANCKTTFYGLNQDGSRWQEVRGVALEFDVGG